MARTGPKVLRGMARLQMRKDMLDKAIARDVHKTRCGRYWARVKQVFRQADAGPFYSLVQDATRVRGIGVLLTALYSCSLSQGCWPSQSEPGRNLVKHEISCSANSCEESPQFIFYQRERERV